MNTATLLGTQHVVNVELIGLIWVGTFDNVSGANLVPTLNGETTGVRLYRDKPAGV